MRKVALVLVLVWSGFAFGQGSTYSGVAQTATGQALAGVSVAICTGSSPGTSPTPCSAIANTYTDITLGTACTAYPSVTSTEGPTSGVGCTYPGVTDGYGNFTLFQSSGTYWEQIYGTQITTPYVKQIIFPATGTGTAGGLQGEQQSQSSAGSFSGETGILWADQFSGADIGAQVNAAYASPGCPSAGCTIQLPATASCLTFTTGIAFSTAGKCPILRGSPAGGTCIKYTPSSGTALTIDCGTSTHPYGAGVRDLTIEGACTNSGNTPVCSGVTSVGLSLGPSGGLEGGYFENVRIGVRGAGFLNGVLIGNSFSNTFINPMLYGNSVGWNQPVGTESNHIFGGSISQNIHGITIAGTGPELYVYGTHFDDNTTCAVDGNSTNYILHLFTPHFENVGGGTNCFANLTGNGGRFEITGGQAYDHLGGSAMFTFNGNEVASWGLTEYNAGSTSAEAWNLTNNATSMADLENINISLGGTITAEYNSAYTGRRWTRDMNPSANPAPVSMGGYYLQPTQISQFTTSTLPTGGFINLPDNSLLATWENHAASGTCGLSKNTSDQLIWSGTGCTVMFPTMNFTTTARFEVTDQGTCTMSAGTCGAQSLASTYSAAPQCIATWNGTGTCTGILSCASTTGHVTPASSVNTDTCHMNWVALGN